MFCFHFFIEIENFRGEGKILMRYTYDTTFSEKILDFYKILEESEQFGVRDQDQFSQKMVKCDRCHSHICFRLIGYDTTHLE
jgi:hypothetical protein